MAARKDGKKIGAGQRAAEGKRKDIRRKCGEGLAKRPNTRASTSVRQTRATAKQTVDRLDRASSSPQLVKQGTQHGKPVRAGKVKLVEKVRKDFKDDNCGVREESRTQRACTRSRGRNGLIIGASGNEDFGMQENCLPSLAGSHWTEQQERAELVEKVKDFKDDKCGVREESRTQRACTRSRGRNGLIIGASGNENLGMQENCLPSLAGSHWTEQQERALAASLATIKPGVNFWRLIAERVSGRSAEDCFRKFYSARSTTRAAKRSRTEEANCALRNSSAFVGSIRSKTSGPVIKERNTCGKGRNAGTTRQTTAPATHQGTTGSIGGASKPPDFEQVTAKKRDNMQRTDLNVKVRQRVGKDSKKRTGRQDLVEKPEIQVGGTLPVTLASVSEDGDREIEHSSNSMDGDLWTTAQEAALQDAYAAIKPSANFWHLISKQVPGRSAEECFNKFYSAHPTPPRIVPAPRPCLKEVDFPPSPPNPLQPPKPKTTGAKRLLEAHKIVRNILRRQQVDDEDYEADAFAALEPPDVVCSVIEKAKDDGATIFDETDVKHSVYDSLPGGAERSTTQCGRLDKENRKPRAVGGERSEFGIIQSEVFSPEILKKVKDPSMLDKYIDHFHQRRTRRRGTKSSQNIIRTGGSHEHNSKDGLDFREIRMDAIRRAKQELRDVFMKPGRAVDEPFLDLLNDSTDEDQGNEKDESEDSL